MAIKTIGERQKKKFMEPGVAAQWVEPLIAPGYDQAEKLNEVEIQGQLIRQKMGYRKKNKLEIAKG